jgi:hypothetical protein
MSYSPASYVKIAVNEPVAKRIDDDLTSRLLEQTFENDGREIATYCPGALLRKMVAVPLEAPIESDAASQASTIAKDFPFDGSDDECEVSWQLTSSVGSIFASAESNWQLTSSAESSWQLTSSAESSWQLTSSAKSSFQPTSSSGSIVGSTLPSIGSADHLAGLCKPCGFLFKGGCTQGPECKFCHLCEPGTIQEKRRRKRRLVRSKHAAAQARAK